MRVVKGEERRGEAGNENEKGSAKAPSTSPYTCPINRKCIRIPYIRGWWAMVVDELAPRDSRTRFFFKFFILTSPPP